MNWPTQWIEKPAGQPLIVGPAMQGQTLVVRAGSEVRVQAGVEARVLEMPEANAAMTRLELEPSARVQWIRLQNAANVGHLKVTQQRQSSFQCFMLSAAGSLHTEVEQVGIEAECQIHGLYLAQGTGVVENRVRVVHRVPMGRSHQNFKGLLAEGGKARFIGQIRIEAEAQEVDSRQLSTVLVLGQRADIVTQPELEILADNVKAAHGATVGQLDEDELFYLESRGLPPAQAVRLLARAFLNEVLMKIEGAEMRDFVWQTLKPALTAMEEQFVRSRISS